MQTRPMRKTLVRTNSNASLVTYSYGDEAMPDPVAYQRRIEERPLHITSVSRIRRIASLVIHNAQGNNGNTREYNSFYCNKDQMKGIFRTLHSWERCEVVRRWWICEGGDGSVTRWTRLNMAQAQRDGYNYHYARWVLTQGTKAEGCG